MKDYDKERFIKGKGLMTIGEDGKKKEGSRNRQTRNLVSDTKKTAEIQFFDRRWVNSHLEENDALEGAILKRRK